jgi:NAD(P)-dependent dehydrogenase (short-subunit alcohol dehydrogenase family)
MSHAEWTARDIPQQDGRSFLVTGPGGLGFEVALALCRAGAEVILAGRNPGKGNAALNRIQTIVPSAKIRFEQLDLASLDSVREFGQRLRRQRESLDVLVNNAGIMATPIRQTTADGLEGQLATNFLGAFALTARLMPLLRAGRNARLVMVSSLVARRAKITFDDLQSTRNYKPTAAYAQSKLADLIFALEFERRSEAGGWSVLGLAAHPGISATELITNGPGHQSVFGIMQRIMPFMFQSPERGALPFLYAATSKEAKGGSYYGPNGFGGLRGYPVKAPIPSNALDRQTASRLWEEACSLTGVSFDHLKKATS